MLNNVYIRFITEIFDYLKTLVIKNDYTQKNQKSHMSGLLPEECLVENDILTRNLKNGNFVELPPFADIEEMIAKKKLSPLTYERPNPFTAQILGLDSDDKTLAYAPYFSPEYFHICGIPYTPNYFHPSEIERLRAWLDLPNTITALWIGNLDIAACDQAIMALKGFSIKLEDGPYYPFNDPEIFSTAGIIDLIKADPQSYLDNYPNHHTLIRGMLNREVRISQGLPPLRPIDLNHTIGFEYIGSDVSKLPSYERHIILADVMDFIDTFEETVAFPQHVTNEKLAPMAYTAMLLYALPPYLVTSRMKQRNTSTAHESFIWEYLDGYDLNKYKSILTRDQALFLYKNMAYLKGIRGTTNALNLLIKEFLDPYGVKVWIKRTLKSHEGVLSITKPQMSIISQPYNSASSYIGDSLHTKRSVESLYSEELHDGIEPGIGPRQLAEQEDILSKTVGSTVPTKIMTLGSDVTLTEITKLGARFLLENVFRQAVAGNRPDISVAINGADIVKMTAKEGFAALTYMSRLATTSYLIVSNENKDSIIDRRVIVDSAIVDVNSINVEGYIGRKVLVIPEVSLPTKVYYRNCFNTPADTNLDPNTLLSGMYANGSAAWVDDSRTNVLRLTETNQWFEYKAGDPIVYVMRESDGLLIPKRDVTLRNTTGYTVPLFMQPSILVEDGKEYVWIRSTNEKRLLKRLLGGRVPLCLVDANGKVSYLRNSPDGIPRYFLQTLDGRVYETLINEKDEPLLITSIYDDLRQGKLVKSITEYAVVNPKIFDMDMDDYVGDYPYGGLATQRNLFEKTTNPAGFTKSSNAQFGSITLLFTTDQIISTDKELIITLTFVNMTPSIATFAAKVKYVGVSTTSTQFTNKNVINNKVQFRQPIKKAPISGIELLTSSAWLGTLVGATVEVDRSYLGYTRDVVISYSATSMMELAFNLFRPIEEQLTTAGWLSYYNSQLQIGTGETFSVDLERAFETIYHDYKLSVDAPSTLVKQSLSHFYDSLRYREDSLVDLLGEGYDNDLQVYPAIAQIIEYCSSVEDPRAAAENVAHRLMLALIEDVNFKYAQFEQYSDTGFDQLKDFMTQLCSYYITFIREPAMTVDSSVFMDLQGVDYPIVTTETDEEAPSKYGEQSTYRGSDVLFSLSKLLDTEVHGAALSISMGSVEAIHASPPILGDAVTIGATAISQKAEIVTEGNDQVLILYSDRIYTGSDGANVVKKFIISKSNRLAIEGAITEIPMGVYDLKIIESGGEGSDGGGTGPEQETQHHLLQFISPVVPVLRQAGDTDLQVDVLDTEYEFKTVIARNKVAFSKILIPIVKTQLDTTATPRKVLLSGSVSDMQADIISSDPHEYQAVMSYLFKSVSQGEMILIPNTTTQVVVPKRVLRLSNNNQYVLYTGADAISIIEMQLRVNRNTGTTSVFNSNQNQDGVEGELQPRTVLTLSDTSTLKITTTQTYPEMDSDRVNPKLNTTANSGQGQAEISDTTEAHTTLVLDAEAKLSVEVDANETDVTRVLIEPTHGLTETDTNTGITQSSPTHAQINVAGSSSFNLAEVPISSIEEMEIRSTTAGALQPLQGTGTSTFDGNGILIAGSLNRDIEVQSAALDFTSNSLYFWNLGAVDNDLTVGGFTLDFLYEFPATNATSTIFLSTGGNLFSSVLSILSNTLLQTMENGGSTPSLVTSGIKKGRLTLVVDYNRGTGKVFLNAVQVLSFMLHQQYSALKASLTTQINGWNIAASYVGTAFKGKISYLSIYNTIYTTEEIQNSNISYVPRADAVRFYAGTLSGNDYVDTSTKAINAKRKTLTDLTANRTWIGTDGYAIRMTDQTKCIWLGNMDIKKHSTEVLSWTFCFDIYVQNTVANRGATILSLGHSAGKMYIDASVTSTLRFGDGTTTFTIPLDTTVRVCIKKYKANAGAAAIYRYFIDSTTERYNFTETSPLSDKDWYFGYDPELGGSSKSFLGALDYVFLAGWDSADPTAVLTGYKTLENRKETRFVITGAMCNSGKTFVDAVNLNSMAERVSIAGLTTRKDELASLHASGVSLTTGMCIDMTTLSQTLWTTLDAFTIEAFIELDHTTIEPSIDSSTFMYGTAVTPLKLSCRSNWGSMAQSSYYGGSTYGKRVKLTIVVYPATRIAKHYINGKLAVDAILSSSTQNDFLGFGQELLTTYRTTPGKYSNIAVYNIALSEDVIASNAEAIASINDPNLIHFYAGTVSGNKLLDTKGTKDARVFGNISPFVTVNENFTTDARGWKASYPNTVVPTPSGALVNSGTKVAYLNLGLVAGTTYNIGLEYEYTGTGTGSLYINTTSTYGGQKALSTAFSVGVLGGTVVASGPFISIEAENGVFIGKLTALIVVALI